MALTGHFEVDGAHYYGIPGAGCVRLALENAIWIYRNIPSGTKVVIH